MTHPVDFRQAYGRFLAPIRAKCRRLVGQTAAADDVAQEAFLRLWQSGPPLDGTTETRTIMAWLYLTSTRLALDVLRQGRALPLDELLGEPRAPQPSPVDVVAARKVLGVLHKDVRRTNIA
jgi:RNA polymerase sigma-70 factor (ECF subfamily)